jgi:hypothetical protein
MTVPENVEKQESTAQQVNVPMEIQLSDEDLIRKYSYPNNPPMLGSVQYEAYSAALERARLRNVELNRKTSEKDLEDVLSANSGIDAGERLKLALAIRMQLKKNKRRSRFMFWSGWLFFLSLLSGLGYMGYVYAMNNIHGERYTVPYTCKFQYGDSELEGHRFLSFPVKTLSGWRWTPPWAVVDEKVEIVLKGDPIIFVGVNEKGKTWRKEFGKGEFGVAILPISPTYWVIGKNSKETTVIQHADFCK